MDVKEKLKKWLDCCLPESGEGFPGCKACPYYEPCYADGGVSVPIEALEDVRETLSDPLTRATVSPAGSVRPVLETPMGFHSLPAHSPNGEPKGEAFGRSAYLLTEADFEENPAVDDSGDLPAWAECSPERREQLKAEWGENTITDGWVTVGKEDLGSDTCRYWTKRPVPQQMEETPWP